MFKYINLKNLKELNANENLLKNLNGIENLKKLEDLNVGFKKITEFPDLSSLFYLGCIGFEFNFLKETEELKVKLP